MELEPRWRNTSGFGSNRSRSGRIKEWKKLNSIEELAIESAKRGGGFKHYNTASQLITVKKLSNGTFEIVDESGKVIKRLDNFPSVANELGIKIGRGKSGARADEIKYLTDSAEMKPFNVPPKDGFDAFLERKYIEIRKIGLEDVPAVARDTGLTEEQIVKMKEHLFLTVRDLSVDGKPYQKLFFQADADIAYAWQQAQTYLQQQDRTIQQTKH